MPSSVGPHLDRLFSEVRGGIRAGGLPIVLSDDPGGADDRGALAITRDGRVAGVWHDLGGWYARTVLEINVAYRPTLVSAALVLHEAVHFQIGPHGQSVEDTRRSRSDSSQGLDCLHHSLQSPVVLR